MNQKIGFMQGRLSPLIGGKIQSFPWDNWECEFAIAESIDIKIMEWTLDQEKLYENPLLNRDGQEKITNHCKARNFSIPSITGDCFMQSPFWKAKGVLRQDLERDFIAICEACSKLNIKIIVIPLVDYGRIENNDQKQSLISFLSEQIDLIKKHQLRIAFESDFPPLELANLIDKFDIDLFGINYDIGNSASMGFDSDLEFNLYGSRIINVHIKDRLLNGTTVSLGEGNANFPKVFEGLKICNYQGNYILQTARAIDGNHTLALNNYKKFILNSFLVCS